MAVRHEHVEARLWQDLFYAVVLHERARDDDVAGERRQVNLEETRGAHRPADVEADGEHHAMTREDDADHDTTTREDDADHHGAATLASQVEDFLRDGHVLVMPVMVSGAPYPEDVERRKRSRYAVIAALHSNGYHPVSNRYIGYLRDAWPSTFADEPQSEANVRAGHSGDQILVPFEWFETDVGVAPKRRVLVLWTADEAFSEPTIPPRSRGDSATIDRVVRHFPLLLLSRLLDDVLRSADCIEPDCLRVSIIGPAGSGTLRRMALESSWYAGQCGLNSPDAKSLTDLRDAKSLAHWDTRIYSPWSTMDEVDVGLIDAATAGAADKTDCPPANELDGVRPSEYPLYVSPQEGAREPIRLVRTLHTDTRVLDALTDELHAVITF